MNISSISILGTKGMSVGTKAGELIVGFSIVDKGVAGGSFSVNVGMCIAMHTCGVIIRRYAS